MANAKAWVVTPWVARTVPGTFDHPKLEDDHQLISWTDVTGQPVQNISPEPNEYTVEIICTEAVLDAIEADAQYEVLWSEDEHGTI